MPFCKGMLRRVLHRVTTGTEAVVSVDSTTGRIVMDIGSAFSRDVYLAAHVTAVPYDEGTIEKECVFYLSTECVPPLCMLFCKSTSQKYTNIIVFWNETIQTKSFLNLSRSKNSSKFARMMNTTTLSLATRCRR